MVPNFYKLCAMVVVGFSLIHCDPIESGEAPTFTGSAQATVLSETQIALSWSPGSDDIVDSDELRYGIWYEKKGTAIDLERPPKVITNAGVIGYNLIDLEPETEYEAIVRARDLGSQYSENTQVTSFTTPAENAGRFRNAQVIDPSYQIEDMISGFVTSQRLHDIGLINGSRIRFHAAGPDGISTQETFNLNVGAAILEAYFVPTRSRFSSDLFVVTATALIYYQNTNGRFEATPTWQILRELAPQSLSFFQQNGRLVAFSYLDTTNVLHLYSNDAEDEEVNDIFVDRGEFPNLNSGARTRLALVDGDAFVDIISFGLDGLRISFGNDEDYKFDSPTTVDSDFQRINDVHTLLVADGDSDGDPDVYIFERDPARAITKLIIYENNRDGSFADPKSTDYASAKYDRPVFTDSDGDGMTDLSLLQTASNNVALFKGMSDSFQQLNDYFGAEAGLVAALWGEFDETDDLDLVLATEDKISLLRKIPTSAKTRQSLTKP